MALTSTVYRLHVTLSDVDRSVYETLDLRMARHPSESTRFFWLRVLGYCLSYEEGIAFSKGGLSDSDEPPISIRDATGILLKWIEIGSPSAERLHRAAKAARGVALFSASEWTLLEREAASRKIHALDRIEVFLLEPKFLDALEQHLQKQLEIELVRSSGTLYVTLPGGLIEGSIRETRFSV
ncbi:MAG TPA: YaeQ family protein [Polyangiaceae bacterium]|nr:YaeQ family protein [Polyangiaceae bacterium]